MGQHLSRFIRFDTKAKELHPSNIFNPNTLEEIVRTFIRPNTFHFGFIKVLTTSLRVFGWLLGQWFQEKKTWRKNRCTDKFLIHCVSRKGFFTGALLSFLIVVLKVRKIPLKIYNKHGFGLFVYLGSWYSLAVCFLNFPKWPFKILVHAFILVKGNWWLLNSIKP